MYSFLPKTCQLYFLFSLLLFPEVSIGQHLNFHHFTEEEGYIDQTGFEIQIEQDQSGFLWIPTLRGLYRYDGQEFKLFRHEPGNPHGLSTNIIRVVFEDSAGKLWVGTGNGIHIYDPETGQFEHLIHDPNDPESLCGNDVRSIGEDKDGNIWVGVLVTTACVCDKEERKFKKKFNPAGDVGFLQKKDGTIWLSGVLGLFKYVPEQDSLIHFQHPAVDDVDSLHFSLYGFVNLFERSDGKIWGTSKRLWKGIFDPITNTFQDFPAIIQDSSQYSHMGTIFQDQNDEVWFGGVSSVAKYDSKKNTFQNFIHQSDDNTSCQNGYITSMFQDRAGSMWFSTFKNEGLSVVHSPTNPFESFHQKEGDFLIMLDDQRLLSTSYKGKTKAFDIETGKETPLTVPSSIKDYGVSWILLGPDHSLWWSRYSNQQRKTVLEGIDLDNDQLLYSPWVNFFSFDVQANLWFNDPSYLDRNTGKRVQYIDKILAVDSSQARKKMVYYQSLVDKQGRVWLGSSLDGLVRYNPQTDEVKFFDPDPADPYAVVNGSINMLYEGTNGWIYILTANGMSVYQEEKERFVRLALSQGTVQKARIAVIEDNRQNIWLGLTEALIRINTQDLSIQKFNESDGLPAGHFSESFTKDSSGRIYFSKNKKIYRFNPDHLYPDTLAYPVILTDFYLNHELIEPNKEGSPIEKNIQYVDHLELESTQSDFGFRFISPDFKKGERLEYYYLLENYSKDWVKIGRDNEVHFTNISHGDYRFKVKVKTPAGIWTPEQKGLKITVFPAWWETWWFYLLIVCSIAGLVFTWIYRLRAAVNRATKKIKADKEIIEQQAEQLLELDKAKSRFFTNISHEFRTPLTVIIGMVRKTRNQPKKWMKEGSVLIERNAENLLNLVNQILDLRKLESGKLDLNLYQANVIPYLQYIFESFDSLGESKLVQLHFLCDLESVVMDYDPEKLLRIVSNLLSNAIKFTPENGNIYLIVRKENIIAEPDAEQLIIQVKDTGIGIPVEKLEKIFDQFYQLESTAKWAGHGTGIGLALCKELVNLMGGHIEAESKENKGSIFTVRLPIQNKAPLKEVAETIDQDIEELYVAEAKAEGGSTLQAAIDNKPDLPLILLIDDNRDVLQYLIACLEGKYQLAVARDGQEGIEKALEIIPDVIISDIMMPKKNGYEVCNTLKLNEKTSHIPIILLTAKASEYSRIEGLQKGADAYITKPFREEELLIRLNNIIDSRRKIQLYYRQHDHLASEEDQEIKQENEFLQKIRLTLESHLDDSDYGIIQICRDIGMSRAQLHRKLKALTGQSASIFLRRIRLHKAKELLETTDYNSSQVAYAVGFRHPSYFAKLFLEEFGHSPHETRK